MALVTIEIAERLAIVTLDNPPVNALGQALRAELLDACRALSVREDLSAVVLCGRGRTFVGGADIRELGQPLTPVLPDLLAAIEAAPVPWIAALGGDALGGGLELAMACRARIAAPGARLGLPEVGLGIIPGAGGTVRLPRLVPMAAAIALVTEGKPIGADKALALGLVDRLAAGDLLTEARALAVELAAAPPQPTLARPVIGADAIDWPAEEARLRASARGAEAPLEALAALRACAELPGDKALAEERQRFLRLAVSPQSRALRHVFFAERKAGQSLGQLQAAPADLSRVGVIGGGTMGAGIATALLLAGSAVLLIERTPEAAATAGGRVAEMLDASHRRGVIGEAQRREALERLETGEDYAALAACPLVIEAVFEDMQVKREVFARLDTVLPAEAILATNTSYLDIDALAATTRDPSRVLGLHFFAPAHVMKLLEVVRGQHTGPRALATGAALSRHLRKTCVVARVCDGFIGNRIMAAYRRDCEFMLEEGALPEEIDAAMREFGFAMGLFEVQDMSGLDIAWARRKAAAATRDPAERYASIADRLCEAGRLGRKTGCGWYDYPEGRARPSPEVRRVIEEERARAGHPQQVFTAQAIMARILGVMQAEGQALLDEGIAESADDIDVVMITGYGFPRHRGGPMYMAGAGGE